MKSLMLVATLLVLPAYGQTGQTVAPAPGPDEAPAAVAAAAPAVGDAQHPAIAVLPLRGQAARGFGDPGDAVYQRVTASFFKTRRFTMIERAQLGAILGEGKNQNTVAFDDASAVALGKQVGAKLVVIGSFVANLSHTVDRLTDQQGRVTILESYPADVSVSLRMVNVESGNIQEVMDAKGASREGNPAAGTRVALEDLSRKLEREVSNHFPAFGYVIKVLDAKQAMIDLGKADGVAEKDEFAVFERGEDIIHPVTGKVIKGEKKLITEFKVVSVNDDSAIVKITGSSVALKPGMALESKPKKRGFFEALNDIVMK